MMRKPLLLVSFLAAAPQALADMASDYWSSGTGVWLFHVDDGQIFRSDCDDDRLIYNRSTCATVVGSADFAEFSERLRAKFAEPLAGLEQQVADIHARIQEIDFELLTLLETVPNPVDPTLKDQIATKEGEVNEAAAALLPLEDQIARIEAELRGGENPDLRRQLILLQGQLVDGKTALDALRVDLAALRQRYIEANAGSFEPRRFETLQEERSFRARQLTSRQDDLERVMLDLIAVSQVMTDVLQQGFTNVYLSGTTGDPGAIRLVINAFKDIFELLDPQSREFHARLTPDGRTISIHVPKNPAYLEQFHCKLQNGCGDAEPWIEVKSPLLETSLRGPLIDMTPGAFSHSVLRPMQSGNVGGTWYVTMPHCSGQIIPGFCFLTIKP